VLAAALWGLAPDAQATCTLLPVVEHTIDVSRAEADADAPGSPVLVSVDVSRRQGVSCQGERCFANSCGDSALVTVALAPSADDEDADGIGYRLELVDGTAPDSVARLLGKNLSGRGPVFLRPGFDEVLELDVTLRAVAIDAAGNESAPGAPFDVTFAGCTFPAVGQSCVESSEPFVPMLPEAALAEQGPVIGAGCAVTASPRTPPGALLLLLLGALWIARRRGYP
jgi:MYXO-CTERM domain-containing protein